MKNIDEFLQVMQSYDGSLTKPEEAIEFAVNNSELVGDLRWLGEFKEGTFYMDTERAAWFPGMTSYEAKLALVDEIF